MLTYTKEEYIDMIRTPPDFHREMSTEPKYKVGDIIRSSNLNPVGHTRFPRYARSKTGEVVEYFGACVLPDSVAKDMTDENPQHLYLVKFSAKELWGPEAAGFYVYVSLFDEYIEAKC